MDVDDGDNVPPHLVKDSPLFGLMMRERGGQCIALAGTVGEHVRCRIYEVRPQVCRDFVPGSACCIEAQRGATCVLYQQQKLQVSLE